MLCQERMDAPGKEMLPDKSFADDIRRRSNIMMGRMSQRVINLVVRRPLDEFARRLRQGRADGCTVDGRKCKESISDEGVSEGG